MIDLRIVTPHGTYLRENVRCIIAMSVEGQFTLLPNHMPVVFALVPCRLVLEDEQGQRKDYAISGGFLHYDGHDQAQLLTDAIEGRSEIDIKRAHAAYERARARLDKKDDHTNMKRAELSLQRAINRIHVSGSETKF